MSGFICSIHLQLSYLPGCESTSEGQRMKHMSDSCAEKQMERLCCHCGETDRFTFAAYAYSCRICQIVLPIFPVKSPRNTPIIKSHNIHYVAYGVLTDPSDEKKPWNYSSNEQDLESSAGLTKAILEKLGHFDENIFIELRADRCSGFRCSGVANF